MTYIDSLAQLEALRDDLKRVKEFAIDLEVGLLFMCIVFIVVLLPGVWL